jgi:predicted aldo/keto reductase-like oxidoreductase
MQYRKFGKVDWKPSVLGFGTMRLPVIGGDMSKIDEAEAIRMIRFAIDHGVNYVDTAYVYHQRNSEGVVGKALQDGYREKVKLATKLSSHALQTADDMERVFNEQLLKLQTDKIDFYLMHGLNNANWQKIQEWKALEWAENKVKAGKIGYLGFSFHDEFPLFKKIIDSYDNWTFCQIQYNYMDVNNQAGRKGVDYAASKNLGIVVMEPIRGGGLAWQKNEAVTKLWQSASIQRSPVDWALQWVWNQPEISLALSGMSTMQQVEENIASAERSRPNQFSQEELDLIDKVRNEYLKSAPIPCTKCRYCLPCENGVDIPNIFEIYNEAAIYDHLRHGRFQYMGGLTEKQRASSCLDCGKCEEVCPQHIPIRHWLKKAHEVLYNKDLKKR